jgi:ribonucleoside-diphosphate reductase alpha chain
MDGIFRAIWQMAMIQKSGGGTGFSFSRLRPSGDPVTTTIGEASGPISFMKAFNSCTDVVKQGGARRGANMGILRVDHPDILEFIDVKSDLNELTNFNISVGITNEFMHCLETEELFQLRFKGVDYAKVDPKMIWDKIVQRAWSCGEPGIIFLDKINADNPTPAEGEIESTNPCGEQPLLPFESCNLGSVNLANMVRLVDGKWEIDWGRLGDATALGTRMLDNVIDINSYPLPEIEQKTKANRKIGLGVMGLADMLCKLKIPYDTRIGRDTARQIMRYIQEVSHRTSNQLAEERGCFPNWEKSVWGVQGIAMRNAATITIAPTGTLSVVASVSSGIEPLFALSYEKDLSSGTIGEGSLTVLNDLLVQYLIDTYTNDQMIHDVLEEVKKVGSLKDVSALAFDAEVKQIFKIASDIKPLDHIAMQSAIQEFTDNAVSKTINFDNDTTPEQISDAMMAAFQSHCKGVTCYRDGSRNSQPLTKGSKDISTRDNETCDTTSVRIGTTANCSTCSLAYVPERIEGDAGQVQTLRKRIRPDEVEGSTKKVRTGCGSLYVTLNHDAGDIFEVFLDTGSTGGCVAFTEGTARLISLALRYGISAQEISSQLSSVRCDNFRHQTGKDKSLKGKSCPDVVGSSMLEKLNKLQTQPKTETYAEAKDTKEVVLNGDDESMICPDCGRALNKGEGCITCRYCGFSKC